MLRNANSPALLLDRSRIDPRRNCWRNAWSWTQACHRHRRRRRCRLRVKSAQSPSTTSAGYFFDHAAPIIGNIYDNDTDPNLGASIVPGSVVIVTPPIYGTALADPNTGQILYTPNTLPASQMDSFTYQIRDTLNLVSNIATVTLAPVGDVIVATDIECYPDLANTVSLKPVSINPLLNDIVRDGSAADTTSVTIVTPPQHGSTVVNPATGVVTYTPDFGFVGFEDLTYSVKTTKTDHAEFAHLFVAVYPSVPRLQADPLGGTMLVVDGTSGNDTIRVARGQKPTMVLVTINGVTKGPFTPTSRIVAFGYSGNDQITIAPDVKVPAWMDGGDGNDVLKGGGGPTIILGRAGNDVLIGGTSRDLLIGGAGTDVIFGNLGDDILVAGTTSFDNSQAALNAVFQEWNSTHSYKQRVQNLTGQVNSTFAKRKNGNTFLNAATIQDDGVTDVLIGGNGKNLALAALSGDVVIGRKKNEVVFVF